MSDKFVNPRKTVKETVDDGIVSKSFIFDSSCKIERFHFSFKNTPADEIMIIALKDDDGDIIACYRFKPLDEGVTEITKAFLQWTIDRDGGSVAISFNNTGNSLDRIVLSYVYDDRRW